MRAMINAITKLKSIWIRLLRMNINDEYIKQAKDEHLRKYGMYYCL